MALNIKNPSVERLATQVALATGETKTEAIRRALEERHHRLTYRLAEGSRGERFLRFLEDEVWPALPDAVEGRPMTRDEEDAILGYGPDGV